MQQERSHFTYFQRCQRCRNRPFLVSVSTLSSNVRLSIWSVGDSFLQLLVRHPLQEVGPQFSPSRSSTPSSAQPRCRKHFVLLEAFRKSHHQHTKTAGWLHLQVYQTDFSHRLPPFRKGQCDQSPKIGQKPLLLSPPP